jgi:hypothetical protein
MNLAKAEGKTTVTLPCRMPRSCSKQGYWTISLHRHWLHRMCCSEASPPGSKRIDSKGAKHALRPSFFYGSIEKLCQIWKYRHKSHHGSYRKKWKTGAAIFVSGIFGNTDRSTRLLVEHDCVGVELQRLGIVNALLGNEGS